MTAPKDTNSAAYHWWRVGAEDEAKYRQAQRAMWPHDVRQMLEYVETVCEHYNGLNAIEILHNALHVFTAPGPAWRCRHGVANNAPCHECGRFSPAVPPRKSELFDAILEFVRQPYDGVHENPVLDVDRLRAIIEAHL